MDIIIITIIIVFLQQVVNYCQLKWCAHSDLFIQGMWVLSSKARVVQHVLTACQLHSWFLQGQSVFDTLNVLASQALSIVFPYDDTLFKITSNRDSLQSLFMHTPKLEKEG